MAFCKAAHGNQQFRIADKGSGNLRVIDKYFAPRGEVAAKYMHAVFLFFHPFHSDVQDAHLQVRSRVGVFPMVRITFPIQDIVLQKFHVTVGYFRGLVVAALMVGEHSSFMDVCLFCDSCKQLVRSQILVYFFHAEIVPCHIFCLEDAPGFHVLIGKPHGGEMVPEEHNHGFFIPFGKHIR